jgi:hypothetical protein
LTYRIRTVEELRVELREARTRFSVREIGRAAGVGRTTVALLLADGAVPRPTTATVRRLSAWLDGVHYDAPPTASPPWPDERAGADAGEPRESREPPRPSGYWHGAAEATVRMLGVAGDELQLLIDSGVLERIGPDAPAAQRPTPRPRDG